MAPGANFPSWSTNRGPAGFVALLAFLVLPMVEQGAGANRISAYRTTTVDGSPASLERSPWAAFNATIMGQARKSPAANLDDSNTLDPLGGTIQVPFFGVSNVTLFVDSNGFLSLVPFSPCPEYCRYASSRENAAAAGGLLWPMIGGYVLDLDPPADASSAILVQVFVDHYGDGEDVAIVEYQNIQQYTPAGRTPVSPCTFQIEISTNGTIIVRFQELIESFFGPTPFTAAVFPDHPSSVVPAPTTNAATGGSSYVAARFDPEIDVCDGPSQTCAQCRQQPGCSWCWTTEQCMATANIATYCASSARRSASTGCEEALPVAPDDPSVQLFYTMRTVDNTDPASFRLTAEATGILSDTLKTQALREATYPVAIPLGFSLPYFDFPTATTAASRTTRRASDGDVSRSSRLTTSTIYLLRDGNLSFTAPSDTATTTPSYYIAPFASSALTLGSDAVLRTAEVGLRAGAFCTVPMRRSGSCGQGLVIEIGGLEGSTSAFDLTIQVILEPSGTVTIRPAAISISPTTAMPAIHDPYAPVFAFVDPPPVVGLARYSDADTGSAVLPQTPFSTRIGSATSFTPVAGCFNCRGRGTCNTTTMLCECGASSTGEGCSQCRAGYFGDQCNACPACLNGGTCDDGAEGTGRCRCPDPWSGAECDVECLPTDPRPLNCSASCAQDRGSCLCGRCTCNQDIGWTGPQCDVWVDPCAKFSLDGCTACVAAESVECNFCSSAEDSRCIAVPQDGLPRTHVNESYVCAGATTAAPTSQQCQHYVYPDAAGSSVSVAIVALALMLLGCVVCIVVFVLWWCRSSPVNPLVANASVGVVNRRVFRREREVVLVSEGSWRPVDGRVQGIPLKQMSLVELYRYQQRLHQLQPSEEDYEE